MAFLEQLLAIVRNTFLECIRQPLTLVVVLSALLLVVLSNQFSAFTMTDDQRMYVDLGLSTVFMAGALLAAFLATSVVDQEITNKTVLMVVSKPVARATFVLGKYLGVTLALLASIAVPAMAFLLVEVHGVMQTAATPVRWPVVVLGVSALAATVFVATWCNFFYGKSFAAIMISLGGPLLLIAYVLSLFFDPSWASIAASDEFRLELVTSLCLMFLALCVLSAIAIAASTRLGQVLTIGVTLGVLVLGLLSDWIFGRRIVALEQLCALREASNESLFNSDLAALYGCKVAYAAVPNFQVFWVVDAVNQNQMIPLEYLGSVVPYGALMITGILAIAIALFQRREVG